MPAHDDAHFCGDALRRLHQRPTRVPRPLSPPRDYLEPGELTTDANHFNVTVGTFKAAREVKGVF